MYRLIRRRVVALAVAYALALNPVLPLLAASAWAGDLGPAGVGEICVTTQSGARSGADLPRRHGPVCPLGMACSMHDCGGGFPPVGAGGVTGLAFGPTPLLFFIRRDDGAFQVRASHAHFARAPPHA